MTPQAKLATLRIDYEFKLKCAEYALGMDEKEEDRDEGFIMIQRSEINLLKAFIVDLTDNIDWIRGNES